MSSVIAAAALLQVTEIIVPLAGIALGGLVVLIPIIGLTARFAIKPLVDAWNQNRAVAPTEERLRLMEHRLGLLEQQVEVVERQNEKLMEDAEFRMKLESGR